MAELDAQKFKDISTSRGLKYHYYSTPAQAGKPTLLLIHGFPSLARDWRKVSLPLEKLGYGLIVPDMLGYGGTDKPTDPSQYRLKLMGQDLVDILDAEGVKKAVAIGHDWGCFLASRLANYFSERFIAYAYFAVSFVIPDPNASLESVVAFMSEQIGYNPYGYWEFMNEDDAYKVFADHLESLLAITYNEDSSLFKNIVCPKGALKKALLEDYKPVTGFASYMTEEDLKVHKEMFGKHTMAGPTSWYKCEIRGFNKPDEAALTPEHIFPPPAAPIFFGAALKDVICTPKIGRIIFGLDGFKDHHVTIKEFDGDHWLVMSRGEEIAKELDAWLSSTVAHAVKALA